MSRIERLTPLGYVFFVAVGCAPKHEAYKKAMVSAGMTSPDHLMEMIDRAVVLELMRRHGGVDLVALSKAK